MRHLTLTLMRLGFHPAVAGIIATLVLWVGIVATPLAAIIYLTWGY